MPDAKSKEEAHQPHLGSCPHHNLPEEADMGDGRKSAKSPNPASGNGWQMAQSPHLLNGGKVLPALSSGV